MDAAREAIRRRGIRRAAEAMYYAEVNVALAEGCDIDEAKERGWQARETARLALLKVQS